MDRAEVEASSTVLELADNSYLYHVHDICMVGTRRPKSILNSSKILLLRGDASQMHAT